MSATGPAAGAPGAGAGRASEEELRAAYEAEIKRVRVENMLLEQVVTMINLGMRRTGLAPGTEDERDPEQVRVAIEALRALMPLTEATAGPQAGAIRDALSQLQLAYVRIGGQPGSATEPAPGAGGGAPAASGGGGGTAGGGGPGPGSGAGGGPPPPGGSESPGAGGAGPAQRSGRLWIPGQ